MPNNKINYSEIQALYELCSEGRGLKEFCKDADVNYDKFVAWQRRQLWNEKLGKTEDKSNPIMSPIQITDMPVEPQETKPEIPQNSIRFIEVRLTGGVSLRKYNTTTREVIDLLTKLTAALC